jgi:Arc/MetJ-type ribon-helix-helix transcriptional regulator
MTIALAKDVQDFLEEQVRAGVCADPSELANDILRSVREQQRQPFEITPELETWLVEAADKPVSPLTKADFESIRERVRARTQTFKA